MAVKGKFKGRYPTASPDLCITIVALPLLFAEVDNRIDLTQ